MITAPTPVLKDSVDQTEVRKAFTDLARAVSTSAPVIQPIASILSSNQTYSLPSIPGMQTVFIPAQFLVSSSASLSVLTLQSSATGSTVKVPILPAGISLFPNNDLLFNIYIDTQGNVFSDDFSLTGSSSLGSVELRKDGVMLSSGTISVPSSGSSAYGVLFLVTGTVIGITYPIVFSNVPILTGSAFTDATGGCSLIIASQSSSGGTVGLLRSTGGTSTGSFNWTANNGRWRT